MKTKNCDCLSVCLTSAYAVLLIAFGITGFVKAGSLISLYSGGGLGVLLLGCSLGMMKGIRLCSFGALGTLIILMAAFFFRALASHKILPIALGMLSLGLFLFLAYRTAYRKH